MKKHTPAIARVDKAPSNGACQCNHPPLLSKSGLIGMRKFIKASKDKRRKKRK